MDALTSSQAQNYQLLEQQVCVCLCVCLSVCLSVFACVYVCVCTDLYIMYVHIALLCLYMCLCMSVCICCVFYTYHIAGKFGESFGVRKV